MVCYHEAQFPSNIPEGVHLKTVKVLKWFSDLPYTDRIEFFSGLLHLCSPTELRFYGSCLEELARLHHDVLRDFDVQANTVSLTGYQWWNNQPTATNGNYASATAIAEATSALQTSESKDIDVSDSKRQALTIHPVKIPANLHSLVVDPELRSQFIISLCLLRSDNTVSACAYFRVLMVPDDGVLLPNYSESLAVASLCPPMQSDLENSSQHQGTRWSHHLEDDPVDDDLFLHCVQHDDGRTIDDLITIYTLAAFHPAFSFLQRRLLNRRLMKFRKKQLETRQAAVELDGGQADSFGSKSNVESAVDQRSGFSGSSSSWSSEELGHMALPYSHTDKEQGGCSPFHLNPAEMTVRLPIPSTSAGRTCCGTETPCRLQELESNSDLCYACRDNSSPSTTSPTSSPVATVTQPADAPSSPAHQLSVHLEPIDNCISTNTAGGKRVPCIDIDLEHTGPSQALLFSDDELNLSDSSKTLTAGDGLVLATGLLRQQVSLPTSASNSIPKTIGDTPSTQSCPSSRSSPDLTFGGHRRKTTISGGTTTSCCYPANTGQHKRYLHSSGSSPIITPPSEEEEGVRSKQLASTWLHWSPTTMTKVSPKKSKTKKKQKKKSQTKVANLCPPAQLVSSREPTITSISSSTTSISTDGPLSSHNDPGSTSTTTVIEAVPHLSPVRLTSDRSSHDLADDDDNTNDVKKQADSEPALASTGLRADDTDRQLAPHPECRPAVQVLLDDATADQHRHRQQVSVASCCPAATATASSPGSPSSPFGYPASVYWPAITNAHAHAQVAPVPGVPSFYSTVISPLVVNPSHLGVRLAPGFCCPAGLHAESSQQQQTSSVSGVCPVNLRENVVVTNTTVTASCTHAVTPGSADYHHVDNNYDDDDENCCLPTATTGTTVLETRDEVAGSGQQVLRDGAEQACHYATTTSTVVTGDSAAPQLRDCPKAPATDQDAELRTLSTTSMSDWMAPYSFPLAMTATSASGSVPSQNMWASMLPGSFPSFHSHLAFAPHLLPVTASNANNSNLCGCLYPPTHLTPSVLPQAAIPPLPPGGYVFTKPLSLGVQSINRSPHVPTGAFAPQLFMPLVAASSRPVEFPTTTTTATGSSDRPSATTTSTSTASVSGSPASSLSSAFPAQLAPRTTTTTFFPACFYLPAQPELPARATINFATPPPPLLRPRPPRVGGHCLVHTMVAHRHRLATSQLLPGTGRLFCPSRAGPLVTCYNCGRPGHSASGCPHRLPVSLPDGPFSLNIAHSKG